MADSTAEKDPKTGRFLPGNSGFGGRPKGSRNKLGEDFIATLAADFEQHGEQVVKQVREEEPATYLRVIATIVPKELNIKTDAFDGLSDADISAVLSLARTALLAHQGQREGAGDTAH